MNGPLYVEITPLLAPHLTGIGRFIVRLIEALGEQVPLRLIALPHKPGGRAFDVPIGVGELPPGDDANEWVEQVLRRRGKRRNLELERESAILYTLHRPPTRHFRRELSIIYDFTPLITPHYHTEGTRGEFGLTFARGLSANDVSIAISESTRADAAWACGLDPARVVVGYPGPSQCVQQHAWRGNVQRREDLLLVVGTREPRKNVQFVVDWFLQTKALPESMRLCWVGPTGWLRALSDPLHSERIHFAGMVSDAELCRLYQEATFSIYPSLYEGFGFPVLDSLWHRCPVACSYNSSLTEFEGLDGVHFFDPVDANSLDAACRELLTREVEICCETLAQRYSWLKLANTVLRLAQDGGVKALRVSLERRAARHRVT